MDMPSQGFHKKLTNILLNNKRQKPVFLSIKKYNKYKYNIVTPKTGKIDQSRLFSNRLVADGVQ